MGRSLWRRSPIAIDGSGQRPKIRGGTPIVTIRCTRVRERGAEVAAVGGARKLRLLLLDACRDNPFAPTMKRTMSVQLVDKGFSDIEPSSGFMVVYAAKHGETALDGEGTDSPFATALARDVREPRVEVRKLFDIVRDDVWASTKHQQQPFTYGSPPGREDFYFVAGK